MNKRALLQPPLASPYAGRNQPKVVYISTKTPFLSAVKRVEKLLRLSEGRFLQSATTIAKNDQLKRKRKGGPDEILDIAETAEAQKKKKKLERGKGEADG